MMFAGASGTAPANGVFPERTMSVAQIAGEQAPGGPKEPPAFHLFGKPAPTEIVGMYAAADAQRGRNDPCTCGSGRKWKRCHGTELVGVLR